MKSGKRHQEEEEEEEDEEFGARRDTVPSTYNTKDRKNSDKTNAIRSKHSVTEQRRRSKINQRFQILRELIPHSNQKRDTASFLLEFLQEKLQKYEGSCQRKLNPTKMMSRRNSHWHVQSHVTHSQVVKNCYGSTFQGRSDDNNVAVPLTMQASQMNPSKSEPNPDASFRARDLQTEPGNKPKAIPMSLQASMPVCIPNDGPFFQTLQKLVSKMQLNGFPTASGSLNQEELTIEGGTINISNVYSQGFLNSLTQALESTALNLSEAHISVQIDLGKRANGG